MSIQIKGEHSPVLVISNKRFRASIEQVNLKGPKLIILLSDSSLSPTKAAFNPSVPTQLTWLGLFRGKQQRQWEKEVKDLTTD